MTAVCETLGVARSNIAERVKQIPSKARGRPPLADQGLVDEIKTIIADMPTYGYRRVHAILRRNASNDGRSWPNVKRVYRVMKVHDLLLQRHTGASDTRRHDGRVAVEQSNLRWCSDGFELAATTKRRCALPLPSTAVTARPLPTSSSPQDRLAARRTLLKRAPASDRQAPGTFVQFLRSWPPQLRLHWLQLYRAFSSPLQNCAFVGRQH